jgi:Zn finger protein HypA/HybF involved in hydrogenase expression
MAFCEICNREVGRLGSHKYYSHNIEMFKCELCDHISKTKNGLTTHLKFHFNKTKILCLNCSKEIGYFNLNCVWYKKFCNHSCAATYNNKIGKFNKTRSFGPISKRIKKEKIDRNLLSFELKSDQERRKIVLQEQKNKCNICLNNDGWYGNKLVFHFHHKDGNKKNNRRENVEYLCPNCHSITDNYGFKGKTHIGRSVNSKPTASEAVNPGANPGLPA